MLEVKTMLSFLFKDYQRAAAMIVFISFATLSAALISQYVFGLNPCELCIYQRIPYVFTIAFGLVAYGAARQDKSIAKFFMILAGITFLVGAGIAAFHVGVEQKWWEGLTSCGGSSNDAEMTLEELRQLVLSSTVVRCDEVAWSLFGVSMAGYNALLSFALAIYSFISLTKDKEDIEDSTDE